MTRFFKNSFLWQFTGGFLIGAAGVVALNAGDAPASSPYSVAAYTAQR